MNFFKPQQGIAVLEDKTVFNPKFVQFKFELTTPHEMPFEAGQYVSIQVSERGDRRSYSICSTPGIVHGFELMVDITPMGLGATYLHNLQFGDQMRILGPLGQFVVQPTESAFTFIATGAGVTPFRSMILDLLQEKHDTRPITLYWGLRHAEDMIWQDELQELSAAFPNFKFHPVLSQSPQEWPLCRGRVTDCLSVHDLMPGSGYYLCGNDKMITDVMALLAQRGILADHVHREKFY